MGGVGEGPTPPCPGPPVCHRRLPAFLRRKVLGDCGSPPAVTQRMHFDPDSVLPFAQLQSAWTAWHPKVPMMAALAPGQLALAANHQAAPAALVEGLPGRELEIEFEHAGP